MALGRSTVRWISLTTMASLLCAGVAGCGKASTGGVSVEGNVSFRGAPLDKAVLTFFPTTGRPIAATVTSGQYEIELMPGDYVATVDVSAELPPGFKEGDPVPPPKFVLPDQYTSRAKSPLKASVAASEDKQLDFDLK